MPTDHDQERSKWDELYASQGLYEETDQMRKFNDEFIKMSLDLLPNGGQSIEVGCGAGWQSLALARSGKFQVTLLDFSQEALDFSRKVFERDHQIADFLLKDAFELAEPEFDLVFNAGVLEHYTPDEKAAMLRAMASRSRKFVLALVPNRSCYWYWLWRIQAAGQENWPYGKEAPLADLRQAFESAGLKYLGHAYIASAWTESMVNSITGLSDELRDLIVQVHRSGVVPAAQTGYLLAALGSVDPDIQLPVPGWQINDQSENESVAEYFSILADALSANIQGNFRAAQLEKKVFERDGVINEQKDSIFQLERKADESDAVISEQKNIIFQLENNLQDSKNTIASIQDQIGILRLNLDQTNTVLEQKSTLLEQKNALITEIYGSRGWKLVQFLWKLRLALLPNQSLRFKFTRSFRNRFLAINNFVGRIKRRETKFIPAQMSWEAYAFDTYKRERLEKYPGDLSRLHVPSKMGLVSIILPVYNGAKYMSEAIDSILDQTYINFELIAINDGSTDNTQEILDRYADLDKRIRVFHQENQKLPRTLSRGIRLARGEFITWTSDDNRLKPEFLEYMVGCLNRHPAWDMVYGNEDIIGEDGQPLVNSDWYRGYQRPMGSNHIYLPTDPSEINVYPNNYIAGAFMYRSRVAWLLGDYSKIRFTTEDYDYWMQVNSLMNLRHTDFNEPHYEYRFHSKSLTNQDKELKITQNRVFLMVYDSFRRDFYLSKMVWMWHSENDQSSVQSSLTESLCKYIERHGHVRLEPETFTRDQLPQLFMPSIYLFITENPASALVPPDYLPYQTLKVLLSLNNSDLPDEMRPEWDLCLALGYQSESPRLKEDYQGWVTSDDLQVLLAAVDIRARCEHSCLIENEISHPKALSQKASVIICTYDRGDKLRNTLTSIAKQTILIQDYEVIVVNNDPSDRKVQEIVTELQQTVFNATPEKLRLIIAPITGLSYARNAGISEAQGEILCFIDDDAIADENWLLETLKAFNDHPETSVIGGYIILDHPEPKPDVLLPGLEVLWSQFLLPHEEYYECRNYWDFPFGANWSARRQALLEIGGFRTRYGRKKQDFSGGEETIAAGLIEQLRYKIAILPQSLVYHQVEQERYTREHVIKTLRASYFTNYQMRKDFYLPFGQPVRNNLYNLFDTYKKLLLRFYRKNLKLPTWVIASKVKSQVDLLTLQVKDNLKRFRKTVAQKYFN